MTRPLRIELAGALYHVTARGDRREDTLHKSPIIWVCTTPLLAVLLESRPIKNNLKF
jgi:hypothetical protein